MSTTNTSEKKIIAVYGATGTQGRAVCLSLLTNPAFTVRALTRDPTSAKATSLASLGIEVVRADGFNEASLLAAFSGCWGAFVNTDSNSPDVGDGTLELPLGQTIANAALTAGIQHLIFSSLPSTTALTSIPCTPFDQKAHIEAHIRTLPIPTTSFIHAGWFYENNLYAPIDFFRGGFPHSTDTEGFITLRFPPWGDDEGAGYIAIEDDFGEVVHGMFLSPHEEIHHAVIHGASEELGYEQYVRVFEEVTGRKTRYVQVAFEEVPTGGSRVLAELVNMFRYVHKMGGRYFGEKMDLGRTEALKRRALRETGREERGLVRWKEWLERHRGEFVEGGDAVVEGK